MRPRAAYFKERRVNTILHLRTCIRFAPLVLLMALNPALAQVVTTIPIGANSASSVDVNPNTNRIFTSGGAATGQVVTMVDGNTNTIVMVMETGSGARVNPMTNKV